VAGIGRDSLACIIVQLYEYIRTIFAIITIGWVTIEVVALKIEFAYSTGPAVTFLSQTIATQEYYDR